MLAANRVVALLLGGVAPALLEPPVNVLRLALHPDGLARRTANLPRWRGHLLARLRRQVEQTADAALAALLAELSAYPDPEGDGPATMGDERADRGVAVPLQLRTDAGLLVFLSTTMVFGTPVDLTLAELAIEAFFPADPETAEALRRIAAGEAGTPDQRPAAPAHR
jgi:hypothetical protein